MRFIGRAEQQVVTSTSLARRFQAIARNPGSRANPNPVQLAANVAASQSVGGLFTESIRPRTIVPMVPASANRVGLGFPL